MNLNNIKSNKCEYETDSWYLAPIDVQQNTFGLNWYPFEL